MMRSGFRSTGRFALVACSASVLAGVGACHAGVVVSQLPTSNMTCSEGVCTPTAASAVLNVLDLENLLAQGSVSVSTTGAGVQAKDIVVDAQLSWTSANSLTLDANRSITVERLISIDGTGALVLTTGNDDQLSFGTKGRIAFQSLASDLTINGASYQLVSDIASMASAIATNPQGNFALADNYDASGDGKYRSTPIGTILEGNVEGLGNSISGFRASLKNEFGDNALFYEIDTSGTVDNLRLDHEKLDLSGKKGGAGVGAGLVDYNWGTLSGDTVEGTVAGSCCVVGGIVDDNMGIIEYSSARMKIVAGAGAGGLAIENLGSIQFSSSSGSIQSEYQYAGGLTAENAGTIDESYSTMNVRGSDGTYVGGISGYDEGQTSNSYASGSIAGGDGSSVGGFDGVTDGAVISASYSTGSVSGGAEAVVGGFLGASRPSTMSDCYWDTTTSGTDEGVGYGGSSGLAGLSTEQLQSGLPAGFKAKVWSEKSTIDDGFPFLKANSP